MRRTVAASLSTLMARVDGFCAKLNHGLAAVAVILAIATAVAAAARHPELMLPPACAEGDADACTPRF